MDNNTKLNIISIVLGAIFLCSITTIENKIESREFPIEETTHVEETKINSLNSISNTTRYFPNLKFTEPILYDQPSYVEITNEIVEEEIIVEKPDIIELSIKLFNDNNTDFNRVDGEIYLDLIATYLEKYAPDGMFISAACAQAYTEGGSGKRGVYSKSNNCFGIMATSSWDGYVYSRSTQLVYKDYETAQKYGATDLFRAYDSIEDSVRDYVSLVDSGRYKDALSTSSAYQYLHTLLSNGYGHMNSLDVWMEMIQFYDLLKYDNAS